MSGGAITGAGSAIPANVPTKELRTLRAHNGPVQVVKFNKDGAYILTGGEDRNIMLWNPYREPPKGEERTGAYIVQEYRAHGYAVMDVCISSDSSRFASCGGDRCAYYWDTSTGNVIRKIFGHDLSLNSVDFNADGTVLATGSNDKTVRCWDLKSHSRAPIQTMGDAKDSISRVVLEDDKIISSSLDGKLRTYDMRMGKCITDCLGAPITSMALSNDKNCVLEATTAGGGTLMLLDRAGGSILSRCARPTKLASIMSSNLPMYLLAGTPATSTQHIV
jgi:mitogen-activated protein kinase organizer 1